MSKKTRVSLNLNQIFEIWRRIKYLNQSARDVSDEMKIAYHNVAGTPQRLDKYIYKVESINAKSGEYLEAADKAKSYLLFLKTEKPVTPVPELKPVELSHDGEDELYSAMNRLQDAIENYILIQIKPIQEENEKLRGIIQTSKKGNWLQNLRQRLTSSQ